MTGEQIAGVVRAIVAAAGGYFVGQGLVDAAKLEGLEGYVDTRKRMDEVDIGDDPAVLRDWLRERAKR
jgi:hypothetical protein